MLSILTFIHIVVCIILIIIILLQKGKDDGLGGAFGSSSSEPVFGAKTTTAFLVKLTGVCAAIFMITSLTQSIIISKKKPFILKKEKIEKTIPKKVIPKSSKSISIEEIKKEETKKLNVPQPQQPISEKVEKKPSKGK
ncbi:MAG: preprotein translocase subunit SecG [bacterium]